MELVIFNQSGQVCRELRRLVAEAVPELDLITAPKLTTPPPLWHLSDETHLSLPFLNPEEKRREADQTSETLRTLLEKMHSLSGIERQAVLTTTLTLTGPHGFVKQVAANCEGTIATQLKGSNHYGFDALFLKYDYDKTFAELSEEIKSRVSQRAKALQKLSYKLQTLASERPACTTM